MVPSTIVVDFTTSVEGAKRKNGNFCIFFSPPCRCGPIGFAFPALLSCPIHCNSLSARHLSSESPPRKLGLFDAEALFVAMSSPRRRGDAAKRFYRREDTSAPAEPGNWVRLVQSFLPPTTAFWLCFSGVARVSNSSQLLVRTILVLHFARPAIGFVCSRRCPSPMPGPSHPAPGII